MQKRVNDIIILYALTFLVYRGWVILGIKIEGDWPYFFDGYLSNFLPPWHAWSVLGSGGNAILDLYRYPVRAIQAFFSSSFGIDYSGTVALLYFYPFLILVVGSMYYLSYTLFKDRTTCFFSSALYALNTVIIWRSAIGQPTMSMSYALLPLVLAFFIKGLKENKAKYAILSGIFMAISMYYEMRIAYVTGIVVLSYFLYDSLTRIKRTRVQLTSIRGWLLKSAKLLGIFLFVIVLFHSFWIFPAFLTRTPTPIAQSGYEHPNAAKALSFSTLLETQSLTHWYWIYDFGSKWFDAEYLQIFWPAVIVIAILAYSAVLFRSRDPIIYYLALLALFLAFLSKGSKPPFGDVYLWLYLHFPGFSAFREPLKFMVAQPLPFSLLFGVTVGTMVHKFNETRWLNGLKVFKTVKLSAIMRYVTPLFMMSILLLVSWPAIAGQIHGMFDSRPIPREYSQINDWLKSQPDGNVLWLPYYPSYVIDTQRHPAIIPSSFPIFGSQPYLQDSAFHRMFFANQTKYIGKILALANIKYVIVCPENEPKWIYFPKGISPYLQVLDDQVGLEKVNLGDNNIHIYRNNWPTQLFYANPQGILVVGGRDTLIRLSPYVNFSRWALFYVDELRSRSLEIWDQLDAIVFSSGKDIDDLTLALVGEEYRLDLMQYAKLYGYESDGFWIKDDNWWFQDNPYELPENQRGLVSAPFPPFDARMDIRENVASAGIYDVWLRADCGSADGVFSLLIDGLKVYEGSFRSTNYTGLKWVKLSSFFLSQGDHTISLLNTQGKNSLDQLILIPSTILDELRNDVVTKISQKKLIFLELDDKSTLYDAFMTSDFTLVNWKKENPSKYILEVEIDEPVFLVFSTKYNPLWRMKIYNKELSPVITYGSLNGFILNKTGNIKATLEFSPQTYLDVGEIISTIGIVTVAFYLSSSQVRKLVLKHNKAKNKGR